MAIDLSKIDWDKLLAFAEKMMAMCMSAGVAAAAQERQLRNPDEKIRKRLERVTERGCLRNGMSRAEWKRDKPAIMAKVLDRGKTATKSEVQRLRARAKLYIAIPDDDDE